MNRTLIKGAAGIGMTVALGISAATNPATAAPLFTHAAHLQADAANPIVDVRWRGRAGWGAGAVAAGIIAGLALAGAASSPYGYGYAPAYGYAPYGYVPGYYGFYGYSPGGRFQDSFRNTY